MAFGDSDLGTFLSDFGVVVDYGAIPTTRGILRIYDQGDPAPFADNSAIGRWVEVLVRTDTLPGLAMETVVSVDGSLYNVTSFDRVNDGAFTRLYCQAISGGLHVLGNGGFVAISQANADLRYRPLGTPIADSEITKTPAVDKGLVSGPTTRLWLLTERSQMQTLGGNTVTTISGIPVGEFLFLDVAQDNVGGHTHAFGVSGLPVLEWDNNITPVQSSGPNTQDSYMFYNEKGARVVGSRTWFNVPTV